MFRSRRAHALAALLPVAALLGTACKKPPVPERVTVLGSILPTCDLSGRLLGEEGSVRCLSAGGKDVRRGSAAVEGDATTWAADAHLTVLGGGVDGWVEPWAKGANHEASFKIFRLTDRVPSVPELGSDGVDDPYVWLDTERARLFAKALGEEIARVDKRHALAIQQRATALEETLGRFDQGLAPKITPLAAAKYATSRPFLGPFAERWKLALVATGPSSGTEAPEAVVARAKGAGATVFVVDRTAPDAGAFVEAATKAGLPVRRVDPIGATPAESYEAFINRFVDDLSKP